MASTNTSVPPPDDRQTITCLYCEKEQEVGRKAMSMTCKYCSKSLKLEDIPLNKYEARRTIETVGTARAIGAPGGNAPYKNGKRVHLK